MSLHDTIVTILEYLYLAIIFLMTAQAILISGCGSTSGRSRSRHG
jgi:hypothetical protein